MKKGKKDPEKKPENEDQYNIFKSEDMKKGKKDPEKKSKDEDPYGFFNDDDFRDESLIAVSQNSTIDGRKTAKEVARLMFDNYLSKGGKIKRFFKRIFVGQLCREGVLKRYEEKAFAEVQRQAKGLDPETSNLGVGRFVEAFMDGYEDQLVHEGAGEKMRSFGVEKNKDGKDVVVEYVKNEKTGKREKKAVDENDDEAKATINMRNAISQYARGKIDLETFRAEMADISEQFLGFDEKKAIQVENFEAVAEAAKRNYDYKKDISTVMEGFKFIQAETRNGTRTEAHRNALEKVVDKITNSRFFRWVPPELVASVASIAASVGITAAKKGASFLAPVIGGAAVSGAVAALKEGNRMEDDLTALGTRIEKGERVEFESSSDSKYDKKLKDEKVQIERYHIDYIIGSLQGARETENPEIMKDVLAKAVTLVKISDEQGVGLLRYSAITEDNKSGADVDIEDAVQNELYSQHLIEQSRRDLDIEIAKIRNKLRDMGIDLSSDKKYASCTDKYNQQFTGDIKEKEEAWRKIKRRSMAVAGVKAGAIAAGTAIVSGLVMRAIGGNAEELIKKNDQVDVKTGLSADDAERLRAEGYEITERIDGREVVQSVDMSAEEFEKINGVEVNTIFANNGTEVADGNELKLFMRDGSLVTDFHGTSTVDGISYNVEELARNGEIVWKIGLTKGTDKFILVPGTLLANGQSQLSDAALADVIAKGEFATASAGFFRDDGSFVSFGTEVGSGTAGTIVGAQEVINEETVYDAVRIIAGEEERIVTGPVGTGFFVPLYGREGLNRTGEPYDSTDPKKIREIARRRILDSNATSNENEGASAA